jgi:hypothetical protein
MINETNTYYHVIRIDIAIENEAFEVVESAECIPVARCDYIGVDNRKNAHMIAEYLNKNIENIRNKT